MIEATSRAKDQVDIDIHGNMGDISMEYVGVTAKLYGMLQQYAEMDKAEAKDMINGFVEDALELVDSGEFDAFDDLSQE